LKELKTPEELVIIMKNNGIHFDIIDQTEAIKFLKTNNYYFKLSAYRKNYHKGATAEGIEFYESLDFAYLKELSTIDMHLRYLIIQMCLDIEHSLKVNLLHNIEDNSKENGYNISKVYLEKYPKVALDIVKHKSSSYCEALIQKYDSDYPIWVLVELISFGNLVDLYQTYNNIYPWAFRDYRLLYKVKSLRNAAAHSNCIINQLKRGGASPVGTVIQFVKKVPGLGNSIINTKLSNRAICDFVTTLYVYNSTVKSNTIKKKRFEELQNLFNGRIIEHAEYFKDNECIKTSFNFCKKIIDIL